MHAQNVLSCGQEQGFKNMKNEDKASEEYFRKLKLSYFMAGNEQVNIRIEFFFAFGKRICNRLIETANFQ